ncbi:MAG: hypothetical protein ABEJ42_00765 [Halobacteriaceae archaeon]
MDIFRSLGRKVEEFKQEAESAAESSRELECADCGARLGEQYSECPDCGSEALVAHDAGGADDAPGEGPGPDPTVDDADAVREE